tara:strand:+ start:554 stop:796 length:243 start_codon:yes stop_codon:yes gene_type:complete
MATKPNETSVPNRILKIAHEGLNSLIDGYEKNRVIIDKKTYDLFCDASDTIECRIKSQSKLHRKRIVKMSFKSDPEDQNW